MTKRKASGPKSNNFFPSFLPDRIVQGLGKTTCFLLTAPAVSDSSLLRTCSCLEVLNIMLNE